MWTSEGLKMSSPHKSIPVSEWTIREQLILASAVQRSGDQNWVSVSRAIKPLVEDVRPADYFSQKNCALQYSAMLDKTGTPKRKRSNEGGSEVVETVEQQIVRQLTEKRIAELNKSLASIKEEHSSLIKEIQMLENGELESGLAAMWKEIQVDLSSLQSSEKVKGSGSVVSCVHHSVTPENHEQVKWNKTILPIQQTSSAKVNSMPTASKILIEPPSSVNSSSEVDSRSLGQQTVVSISPTLQTPDIVLVASPDLKPSESVNPPFVDVKTPPIKVVTTSKEDTIGNKPMHAPHPSTQSTLQQLSSDVHLIVQHPNTAVTRNSNKSIEKSPSKVVSNLPLDAPNSKLAVESSISSNSTAPTISIHSSTAATAQERPTLVQQHALSTVSTAVVTSPKEVPHLSVKLEKTHTNMSVNDFLKSSTQVVITAQPAIASTTPSSLYEPSSPQLNADSLASSCPTKKPTEAVVYSAVEELPLVPNTNDVVTPNKEDNIACSLVDGSTELSSQNICPLKQEDTQPQKVTAEQADTAVCESKSNTVPSQAKAVEPLSSSTVEMKQPEGPIAKESIALQSGSESEYTPTQNTTTSTWSSTSNQLETVTLKHREVENVSEDVNVVPVSCEAPIRESSTVVESEEGLLQSVPSSSEPSFQSQELKSGFTGEEEVEVEGETTIKSHKKSERVLRKPMSRKRRLIIDDEGPSVESTDTEEEPVSTRTSGAPSPAPSQSDMDPEAVQARKQWRKAIMLVWRHAAQHKYANLFLHPVREEDAPGYRDVILRPMDLYTIKRKVESGVIRTDIEFQRDMLLMFQNAFMYNSSDHDVFFMAQEMKNDVMESIQDYLATQAQLQLMEKHHTPQQKTLRSREGRTRDIFEENIFSPAKKRKTRSDD